MHRKDCGEAVAAMAAVYRRCALLPDMDVMNCRDLAVPVAVMRHVVGVESANNPYAIGVVGGRLRRQPANLPEALATARMLEARGYNFSVGLAQVNRYNLGRYGLGSYEKAFQACPNLQAGARILAECHARSGKDWGKAFSCYYSGNFVTGFRDGYVQKVFASMRATTPGAGSGHVTEPIDVVEQHGSHPLRNPVPAEPSDLVARRAVAQSNGSTSTDPGTAVSDARGPVATSALGTTSATEARSPANSVGQTPDGAAHPDEAFVF
jgi:type IV secretion system protein VirB1